MNILDLHNRILAQYRGYLSSGLTVADSRIRAELDKVYSELPFIPKPMVQFNPTFEMGIEMRDFVEQEGMAQGMTDVLNGFSLYRHQEEAIRLGVSGKGYVLTSGTGSGKSLTFMASIFNHVLSLPSKEKGIKAIIVYPMNALINSQEEELSKKFAENFKKRTGRDFPISFAKYTG